MARFKYRPEVELDLAREGSVRLHIRGLAEAAADHAVANAPVDEGDYRDSIHVVAARAPNKFPIERLIADDFKAGWIEFGTEKMDPFRTLGNAVEAVGLELRSPDESPWLDVADDGMDAFFDIPIGRILE